MGEQAKPVDDDVERALASMRAGFLAGSEQIAAHIASLDEHLIDAPAEEREAVHAQVARLVASHDRITARVMSAPASSWDSFKVMVTAVKQQQVVLDQVSLLVKEHVLPRQIESLPITPFPATPPPEEEAPLPPLAPPPSPPLPHDDGLHPGDAPFRTSDIFEGVGARHDPDFPPPPGADFHAEALTVPRGSPPPPPAPQRRRLRSPPPPHARSETGFRALAAAGLRPREEADGDDAERPSILTLVRERTAGFRGLAAMVVVGIILSVLPRERLHEAGSRLFDLIAPAGPALDERPPDAPPAPPVPRSVERVPPADVDAEPPPAPKAKAEPKTRTEPGTKVVSPPVPKGPTPDGEDDAPKAAAVEPVAEKPEPVPAVAPPKEAAEAAPKPSVEAPVALPPAAQRFVPVVFTHKDHATVERALADLKRQYPKVLIGLEGEIQPVDLGRKGIWHRLVFLPAGPRPHAARVCDQLAANGYDRCWVKEY